MKNLSTTFLAMCLTLNLIAGGGEEKAAKSNFKGIKEQISAQISAPFFVMQTIGGSSVFVEFHINNKMQIVIDKLRGSDARIEAHLRKELADKFFYTDRQNIGKSMNLKIIFK